MEWVLAWFHLKKSLAMKTEIFATGTITDATGKEYEIKVRGFRYDDDGRQYSPSHKSTPPESCTEIDESRRILIFVSGGHYSRTIDEFDDTARVQMLELLETEGVPVHQLD